ncbi:DUF2218 domain-containing protein [Streptomyces sp. DSM 41987]|uniref:DUF2218 domain-containing protein n=2 Tax=Streptomyces TaxID=1883 RepID=UPI00110673A1
MWVGSAFPQPAEVLAMYSAEAEIRTDRASRYLVQLCKHFSNRGSALRHRPRLHAGGGRPVTEAEAALMQVQWSETRGEVDFGWALCSLQACRPRTTATRSRTAP